VRLEDLLAVLEGIRRAQRDVGIPDNGRPVHVEERVINADEVPQELKSRLPAPGRAPKDGAAGREPS
jgi:hypothetical protein